MPESLRVNAERGERAVFEGVCGVAGLGEIAFFERVGIHDQDSRHLEVADVGLERRRVHRDENVGRVAGGEDVLGRKVHLESGNAR
jgi:hypothetical protein